MTVNECCSRLIRGYRVGEMFMPRWRKGEEGRGASVETAAEEVIQSGVVAIPMIVIVMVMVMVVV